MAEQLILKNLEFIKVLPYWAQEFSYKYCSQTANLYIVNGNIRDFLPNKMYEGEFVFVRIQEFISDVLFGNKDVIVFYDRSSGINFCTPEMQSQYIDEIKKLPDFSDIPRTDFLTSTPVKAFKYLEKYFLLNINKKSRVVLIIDYAETIIPNAKISELSDNDKNCLVTLNRWAHDPIFTQGDISIILLTENLIDINQKLVSSPGTVKINIPFPDERVRESFLNFLDRQESLLLTDRLTPQRAAKITGGLNLLNLNQLSAESYQEDKPISLNYLKNKKKELIENEAAGLLEFIESDHDLSMVSGHTIVKKRFKSAARALKLGRLDILPMGYLVSGPVGSGKSFMVSAFAGEIGIPIVKFKNFHSSWQGVTESNFEKTLSILKAMSPVGVMVDEADVFLGNRMKKGGMTVGSRIFSQITSFMGDTSYRGRIIWFLITCRPDLIPIDLKRQGRAEEHLSLFYPQNITEREDLFEILVKKLKLRIQKDISISDLLKKCHYDISGADLEAILIRSKFNAAMKNHAIITGEDILETISDFIPPAYPYEIQLQNLVSVLECTGKDMIPKKFRNLERSKLISEIRELKTLLGERD